MTKIRVAVALLSVVCVSLIAFRVSPESAYAQGPGLTKLLLQILSGTIPASIPASLSFQNASGTITSYQPNGATTTSSNGFFSPLGSNGRTCFTCHQPQDGWALTPQSVQATYNLTHGNTPLFQAIDSAVCPSDPRATSTNPMEFALSHAQVLTKANFRIGVTLPARGTQEWAKLAVSYDPLGCENDPKYGLPTNQVSVYRRVLPAANLGFLDPMGPLGISPDLAFPPCKSGGFCLGASPAQNNVNIAPTDSPTMGGFAIMWDAREPSLETQFIDANTFHAQATPLQMNQLEGTLANPVPAACLGVNFNSPNPIPTACLAALNAPENCPPMNPSNATSPVCQAVAFQSNIFAAQTISSAGDLTGSDGSGATGGPVNLFGFLSPTASIVEQQPNPPTPNLVLSRGLSEFNLYNTFNGTGSFASARASIQRGQNIFNTRQFVIAGVAGFSDIPGAGRGSPATGGRLTGTCTNCHNVVNVGDDAGMEGMRTGLGDNFCQHATFLKADPVTNPAPVAPCGSALPPSQDLPLFTFNCPKGSIEYFSNPDPTNTYDVFQTTDPGLGIITGKCNDLGKMKRPVLRGVAARAPYFHGGNAANLTALVQFYNVRFNIGLSPQDVTDLVNFLNSL
jgi:cytochrome c peroxidase